MPSPFVNLLLDYATETTLALVRAGVDAIDAKLPSDPATVTAQATGNASLASIDGKVTECDTGAVTVAASALPAGAATEAGHLATIDTSTATTATNTGTIAGAISAPDATLPASAAQIGGIASTAAPSPVTSGRGVRAWLTLVGAQMVGLLGVNGSGIATGANPVPMQLSNGSTLYTGASVATALPVTFAPSLNTTGATLAVNGVMIKSGAGNALWITITNTTGGSIYWQIYDRASGPPNAGERCAASAPAITANNGSRPGDVIGPAPGLGFVNGCLLVASSSPTTYAAIASTGVSYTFVYN